MAFVETIFPYLQNKNNNNVIFWFAAGPFLTSGAILVIWVLGKYLAVLQAELQGYNSGLWLSHKFGPVKGNNAVMDYHKIRTRNGHHRMTCVRIINKIDTQPPSSRWRNKKSSLHLLPQPTFNVSCPIHHLTLLCLTPLPLSLSTSLFSPPHPTSILELSVLGFSERS